MQMLFLGKIILSGVMHIMGLIYKLIAKTKGIEILLHS